MLHCLDPSHGRGLIYVWATDQDELSKRAIPTSRPNPSPPGLRGQDVFVPWVLAEDLKAGHIAGNESREAEREKKVFNRYYHMFEEGELRELVLLAAGELDICTGPHKGYAEQINSQTAIEIVKDDWERSNYYLEFRLYQMQ